MAFAPYSSSSNSSFRSGNADVARKQKRLVAFAIACIILAIAIYWFGMPKTHPLSQAQLQSDLARMHATAVTPAASVPTPNPATVFPPRP